MDTQALRLAARKKLTFFSQFVLSSKRMSPAVAIPPALLTAEGRIPPMIQESGYVIPDDGAGPGRAMLL